MTAVADVIEDLGPSMSDCGGGFHKRAVSLLSGVWPRTDFHRLISMLAVRDIGSMAATCSGLKRKFQGMTENVRGGGDELQLMLSAEQLLSDVETLLAVGAEMEGDGGPESLPKAEDSASLDAKVFEATAVAKEIEKAYIYLPDWQIKPNQIVAHKGSWIKVSTQFSWELQPQHKLYVPAGMAVPVLHTSRVRDAAERGRHEWTRHHSQIWITSKAAKALQARRGVWFVYAPCVEVDPQNPLVAKFKENSWIKRSCQLSGELELFELMCVPQGFRIYLRSPPSQVTEPWEMHRHAHTHLHLRLHLDTEPVTKPIICDGEKYEFFLGQEGRCETDEIRAGFLEGFKLPTR